MKKLLFLLLILIAPFPTYAETTIHPVGLAPGISEVRTYSVRDSVPVSGAPTTLLGDRATTYVADGIEGAFINLSYPSTSTESSVSLIPRTGYLQGIGYKIAVDKETLSPRITLEHDGIGWNVDLNSPISGTWSLLDASDNVLTTFDNNKILSYDLPTGSPVLMVDFIPTPGMIINFSQADQATYLPEIEFFPLGLEMCFSKSTTGWAKIYPYDTDDKLQKMYSWSTGTPSYYYNDVTDASVNQSICLSLDNNEWSITRASGMWVQKDASNNILSTAVSTRVPMTLDPSYNIMSGIRLDDYNDANPKAYMATGSSTIPLWYYYPSTSSWSIAAILSDSSSNFPTITGNSILGVHNLAVQHIHVGANGVSGSGVSKAVVVRNSAGDGTCTMTFAAGILVSQDCTP